MAHLFRWMFMGMIIFSSCSVVRNTPKYQLADGYYKANIFNDSIKKVYVDNEDEAIYIYPLKNSGTQIKIDTAAEKRILFTINQSAMLNKMSSFRQGVSISIF